MPALLGASIPAPLRTRAGEIELREATGYDVKDAETNGKTPGKTYHERQAYDLQLSDHSGRITGNTEITLKPGRNFRMADKPTRTK
jgi:hypothetical protein